MARRDVQVVPDQGVAFEDNGSDSDDSGLGGII